MHKPLILFRIANCINCFYRTGVVFPVTKYFKFGIGFANKCSIANFDRGPLSLNVTIVSGKSKFRDFLSSL
jgi:hypothetical protein